MLVAPPIYVYKKMSVQPLKSVIKITEAYTLTGWWLGHPSEKYEFVSWDDEIPNIWENNPNVPNHQPAYNPHLTS